jgi:hypothetical protein
LRVVDGRRVGDVGCLRVAGGGVLAGGGRVLRTVGGRWVGDVAVAGVGLRYADGGVLAGGGILRGADGGRVGDVAIAGVGDLRCADGGVALEGVWRQRLERRRWRVRGALSGRDGGGGERLSSGREDTGSGDWVSSKAGDGGGSCGGSRSAN